MQQKLLNKVEELMQQPGNKRCFECYQKFPSFLDVTCGTFVCQRCSGILREFNHLIKSQASHFTVEEVALLERGNTGARQIWMGKYDPTIHPSEPNGHRQNLLRLFMRDKYVNKLYYDSSKDTSTRDEFGEFHSASVPNFLDMNADLLKIDFQSHQLPSFNTTFSPNLPNFGLTGNDLVPLVDSKSSESQPRVDSGFMDKTPPNLEFADFAQFNRSISMQNFADFQNFKPCGENSISQPFKRTDLLSEFCISDGKESLL